MVKYVDTQASRFGKHFFPFTDANNLVLRFVLYYHAICNISDYVSYYIGLLFVLNHIPL